MMPHPFTFRREARWLLVLFVMVPLAGMLIALVVPWLVRQGWW